MMSFYAVKQQEESVLAETNGRVAVPHVLLSLSFSFLFILLFFPSSRRVLG